MLHNMTKYHTFLILFCLNNLLQNCHKIWPLKNPLQNFSFLHEISTGIHYLRMRIICGVEINIISGCRCICGCKP